MMMVMVVMMMVVMVMMGGRSRGGRRGGRSGRSGRLVSGHVIQNLGDALSGSLGDVFHGAPNSATKVLHPGAHGGDRVFGPCRLREYQ
jgi:hypothetical protein